MHSQLFGFMYCGYCERSHYFEVLYVRTANTSGLAVFRGSLLWILPVLLSMSGFCAAGNAASTSIGSISSVGTARTASNRSTTLKGPY